MSIEYGEHGEFDLVLIFENILIDVNGYSVLVLTLVRSFKRIDSIEVRFVPVGKFICLRRLDVMMLNQTLVLPKLGNQVSFNYFSGEKRRSFRVLLRVDEVEETIFRLVLIDLLTESLLDRSILFLYLVILMAQTVVIFFIYFRIVLILPIVAHYFIDKIVCFCLLRNLRLVFLGSRFLVRFRLFLLQCIQ